MPEENQNHGILLLDTAQGRVLRARHWAGRRTLTFGRRDGRCNCCRPCLYAEFSDEMRVYRRSLVAHDDPSLGYRYDQVAPEESLSVITLNLVAPGADGQLEARNGALPWYSFAWGQQEEQRRRQCQEQGVPFVPGDYEADADRTQTHVGIYLWRTVHWRRNRDPEVEFGVWPAVAAPWSTYEDGSVSRSTKCGEISAYVGNNSAGFSATNECRVTAEGRLTFSTDAEGEIDVGHSFLGYRNAHTVGAPNGVYLVDDPTTHTTHFEFGAGIGFAWNVARGA